MRRWTFLLLILLVACGKDQGREMLFLGDSHFSKLDVNRYFINTYNSNEGVSGMTIEELQAALIRDEYDLKQDIILVEIGTNDCIQRLRNGDSDQEIIQDLIAKIHDLISLVESKSQNQEPRVMLCSIIPLSGAYFPRRETGRIYKEINARLQVQYDPYESVELIMAVNGLTDEKGDLKDKFSDDGLHLNALGYERFTKNIHDDL